MFLAPINDTTQENLLLIFQNIFAAYKLVNTGSICPEEREIKELYYNKINIQDIKDLLTLISNSTKSYSSKYNMVMISTQDSQFGKYLPDYNDMIMIIKHIIKNKTLPKLQPNELSSIQILLNTYFQSLFIKNTSVPTPWVTVKQSLGTY